MITKKEKIYTPFTYLIGWSKLEKYYYGVRYADNCSPNELWTTYFTSSKYVQEYRKEFGEPDVIEIRQTFKNKEQALLWEKIFLRKVNAVVDTKWLNRCYGGEKFNPVDFFENATEERIKERNQKVSLSRKLFFANLSVEDKQKYNDIFTRNAQACKTDENRKKNSEAQKQYWDSITPEKKQEFIEVCTTATRNSKEKRIEGLKKYNESLTEEQKLERKLKCIEVENRPEKQTKRKEISQDSEYIENLSNKAKERYSDADYKEKWSSATHTEELNKKRSESVKLAYTNDEVIARHKEAVSSVESREKLSKSSKAKFDNPEFRKAFDERMQSEDYKKKQSDMMKAKCSDPAYKELMKERARRGIETRNANKAKKLLEQQIGV